MVRICTDYTVNCRDAGEQLEEDKRISGANVLSLKASPMMRLRSIRLMFMNDDSF